MIAVCSVESLGFSILEDEKSFVALEREWQDLYSESPSATPFQSWAWLYSWWESYGADYELRIIAIREGDLLVGLLPLMLKRRLGLGQLRFIGSGQSIYLDVIARRGYEERVVKVGVAALRHMVSWSVADLQQLRTEAAAWSLFRDWEGPKTYIHQATCPLITVKSWDELLSALNQKQRSNTRRALRRVEQDGVSSEIAGKSDAEQAASRLVTLHREAWRGRDIGPEHLTQRFESLIKLAARRMTARGIGAVSEFWKGEEVIASHFLVIGHDFVGGYLGGASPEALRRYSISPLYIRDGTSIAHDRGATYFDLMWGEERHKVQWSSGTVTNNRVVLGRGNPVAWAACACYHNLRSKTSRYVNSENAPAWTKNAVDRYRKLRSTFAKQRS